MSTQSTGSDFVAFLANLGKWNHVSDATSRGLITAATNILSVDSDWETTDVLSLNVDELLPRFANMRRSDFKSETLREYGRRFRTSLDSFRQYCQDPTTWKYSTVQPSRNMTARQTQPAKSKKSLKSSDVMPALSVAPDASPVVTVGVTRSMKFPFPLREDFVVELVLPFDLMSDEADRLCRFLSAIARPNAGLDRAS